jgi:DNA-binding transcriptional MerR regulator
VKALRAYHEAGLLVPAAVDPQSGYRSYSVAQLTDAAIIRRLRDLDVPLEAVGQVLDARDPEATRKILAEHGAALQERLAATQRAIDELYVALEAPASHTPVHVRHEPAKTVLALSGILTEEGWQPFFERAVELLVPALTESGAVLDGSVGACFPVQLVDDEQEVTTFLPISKAVLIPERLRRAGVRVDELPAAEFAVIVHRGTYDTLGDTYRNLGAWVATNAEPADLPVRELFHIGAAQVDDPDDYRTDVCWPVTG